MPLIKLTKQMAAITPKETHTDCSRMRKLERWDENYSAMIFKEKCWLIYIMQLFTGIGWQPVEAHNLKGRRRESDELQTHSHSHFEDISWSAV